MWAPSAQTYALVCIFTMSIYYVLSYRVHINVMGIISVQLLCECMDICIHRACLLIAWFYVLSNIGANGN